MTRNEINKTTPTREPRPYCRCCSLFHNCLHSSKQQRWCPSLPGNRNRLLCFVVPNEQNHLLASVGLRGWQHTEKWCKNVEQKKPLKLLCIDILEAQTLVIPTTCSSPGALTCRIAVRHARWGRWHCHLSAVYRCCGGCCVPQTKPNPNTELTNRAEHTHPPHKITRFKTKLLTVRVFPKICMVAEPWDPLPSRVSVSPPECVHVHSSAMGQRKVSREANMRV